MESFLGKITQHAMNYAIRSGIAITSTYAIGQCSRLLKTVDNKGKFHELQNLQERLDSKIKIISPAIDLVEIISARGNTTLESAVSLTRALRWDIQSLGTRLANAANVEEIARRGKSRPQSRSQHQAEFRLIIQDIKRLLTRIEDAVPLINLAITTSGASLSTTLPATVSPSRLLQASTFLTAGDTQYAMNPNSPVQIGPVFILSVYMLYVGHFEVREEDIALPHVRWKEVINKARVRLIRAPLDLVNQTPITNGTSTTDNVKNSIEVDERETAILPGDGKVNEFSYHLQIIEDFDDELVHSFTDGEPQPGPFEGVRLAGIRDRFPIHQVSKIFYADTGKVLNIGNEDETNSPVLLLKRDVNAPLPRSMMKGPERENIWQPESAEISEEDDEIQSDIDHQLHTENSVLENPIPEAPVPESSSWRLPPDLDPEWIAFEVYTESADDSSDEGADSPGDSAYASGHPTSSRESSATPGLVTGMANIDLSSSSPISSPTGGTQVANPSHQPPIHSSLTSSPFGPIRSSLSLMEMLIRLTSLQQFQQASHLAIPDELLTFFLEESSTTGAGGDAEERRRKRLDARVKLGFDPYDESPVKRRGEEYQYQSRASDERDEYYRSGTPYDDYAPDGRRWSRERSFTPNRSPEPWSLRNRERSSGANDGTPSKAAPSSPYIPAGRRAMGHASRAQQGYSRGIKTSPLGRGVSAETDSSLGTSPGTPTLGGKIERGEEA